MLGTHDSSATLTVGLATLQPNLPSRHRPRASSRTRALTKISAAGIELALLLQVAGLCLCVPRAQASADLHACCPQPAPKPGGIPASATDSSITAHARDCCSTRLCSRTDVWLNEREPSAAPAPYPVSSTASCGTRADHATSFDGTRVAPVRPSSLPRSSVLRI